MLSEKRFLPAHLNPTAALPALHTGTAGGCEISFAGNARVGKRSGSVKRRNALLCVRNTSGTAGGGRARAYSPAPVRRHAVGTGKLPSGERFACAPYRLRFALFFGLRWRESYFSSLLFGGSAALCAAFCRRTTFLPSAWLFQRCAAIAGGRRRRRQSGKIAVTRKSQPVCVSAWILPPCAVTMALATESPMP